MRPNWKQARLPLLIAGISLAALIMLLGPFFAAVFSASNDAETKVQAFRALSAKDFKDLLALCQTLGEDLQPGQWEHFGRASDPPVPPEFQRFGFEQLIVRQGEVEGRLYYLFDSGGSARMRFGPSPSIDLVHGDHKEFVSRIYP
jgi:hypothetical protein